MSHPSFLHRFLPSFLPSLLRCFLLAFYALILLFSWLVFQQGPFKMNVGWNKWATPQAPHPAPDPPLFSSPPETTCTPLIYCYCSWAESKRDRGTDGKGSEEGEDDVASGYDPQTVHGLLNPDGIKTCQCPWSPFPLLTVQYCTVDDKETNPVCHRI